MLQIYEHRVNNVIMSDPPLQRLPYFIRLSLDTVQQPLPSPVCPIPSPFENQMEVWFDSCCDAEKHLLTGTIPSDTLSVPVEISSVIVQEPAYCEYYPFTHTSAVHTDSIAASVATLCSCASEAVFVITARPHFHCISPCRNLSVCDFTVVCRWDGLVRSRHKPETQIED